MRISGDVVAHRVQKLMMSLTLLACLFLSFVGGALLAHFELIPGFGASPDSDTDTAERHGLSPGRVALGAEHPALVGSLPEIAPDTFSGVRSYDSTRAWEGFTLISPSSPAAPVRLIDMDGETRHEWRIPDALLRPAIPVAGAAAATSLPTIQAQLVEEGDLIVAVSAADQLGNGGIARINKAGELLWQYRGFVRENFAVTPDGRIYALLRSKRTDPWPGLERIETPFFDDVILQLDSSGAEIRRVSILAAIQNSPFLYLLQYTDPDRHAGDLLGASAINVLDVGQAALLPNASAGDILLSLRQLDVIAVLGLDEPVIKWAARGTWHLQSDIDVLDNGNILLFDGHGDLARGAGARVMEIDPLTLGTQWMFPAKNGRQLLSHSGGSQQRLPNGNTLISDAGGGRLLEVTSAGDVVWEYRIPRDDYAGLLPAPMPLRAAAASRFSREQLELLLGPTGASQ